MIGGYAMVRREPAKTRRDGGGRRLGEAVPAGRP